MKLEMKEDKKIRDGSHVGVITGVEYRVKPYKYTDIVIELLQDDVTYKIKYGLPTHITPTSKLGNLLLDFGLTMETGKSIDPDDYLIGKDVKFMTMTDKKGYSMVVIGSLKPVEK